MEVKEIFLKAAKLLESGHSVWMCHCVKHALNPDKDVSITKIPEIFVDYGFNRKNYGKFIEDNYPELEEHIFPTSGFEAPWIDTFDTLPEYKLIIESKIEFLKSLANGQENNDNSCS